MIEGTLFTAYYDEPDDTGKIPYIHYTDLLRYWMQDNMPQYIMYDKHNKHHKQDYVIPIESVEDAQGADVYEYYDSLGGVNYLMYIKVGCDNEWIIVNTALAKRDYVEDPCMSNGKVFGWAKVDDTGFISSCIYRDIVKQDYYMLKYRLFNRINRRKQVEEFKKLNT